MYIYIYVYDICTYFDCWFFILMCLSHGDVPSSLSEMEPKIPLSLLSHILASNSQTNRASISMGLLSIFNHLGKLQKKNPKPELYTWMSQGSEQMGYNL